MDILAICRFFALPAVLILIGIITRPYGNYVGPRNPTPIKPGHIEIIKKVNR